MARHKSFGNVNPYAESEPVTFDLYDETFTCHKAVQGATLLKFGKDTKEDPAGAVMKFFQACMPDEEYERFEEIIESPDKIVDASTLGEIAGFLVSEYSARPTEPGSSSKSGPPKSGRSSARRR